jgi:hypothetical protein
MWTTLQASRQEWPPSRGKHAGMAERRHEPYELHDADKRSRRGFSETQADQPFTGFEPVIVLDSLLGHVGENGVCAAKCHHGHLAVEPAIDVNTFAGPTVRNSRMSGASQTNPPMAAAFRKRAQDGRACCGTDRSNMASMYAGGPASAFAAPWPTPLLNHCRSCYTAAAILTFGGAPAMAAHTMRM